MTTFTTPPNSIYWLDQFKEAMKLESDKGVADFLGISKQAVSHWRAGKHQLGPAEAIEIGACIGINPLYVLATAAYHASPKPDRQDVWKNVILRLEPYMHETFGLAGKTRSTSADPANTPPTAQVDRERILRALELLLPEANNEVIRQAAASINKV